MTQEEENEKFRDIRVALMTILGALTMLPEMPESTRQQAHACIADLKQNI